MENNPQIPETDGIPLWKNAKAMHAIHLVSVIAGMVAAICTEMIGSRMDLKIGGYSIALILISASQIIRTIANSLDHKDTLDKALGEALPLVLAATKGNSEQRSAVDKALAGVKATQIAVEQAVEKAIDKKT